MAFAVPATYNTPQVMTTAASLPFTSGAPQLPTTATTLTFSSGLYNAPQVTTMPATMPQGSYMAHATIAPTSHYAPVAPTYMPTSGNVMTAMPTTTNIAPATAYQPLPPCSTIASSMPPETAPAPESGQGIVSGLASGISSLVGGLFSSSEPAKDKPADEVEVLKARVRQLEQALDHVPTSASPAYTTSPTYTAPPGNYAYAAPRASDTAAPVSSYTPPVVTNYTAPAGNYAYAAPRSSYTAAPVSSYTPPAVTNYTAPAGNYAYAAPRSSYTAVPVSIYKAPAGVTGAPLTTSVTNTYTSPVNASVTPSTRFASQVANLPGYATGSISAAQFTTLPATTSTTTYVGAANVISEGLTELSAAGSTVSGPTYTYAGKDLKNQVILTNDALESNPTEVDAAVILEQQEIMMLEQQGNVFVENLGEPMAEDFDARVQAIMEDVMQGSRVVPRNVEVA